MAIKKIEEIKKVLGKEYNCGACLYLGYDCMDKKELERCFIAGRYKDFPKNKEVKTLIERYNLKGVCEYWQSREK
jgi:hypothetical protein